MSKDLRPFVAEEIRLHPRVAYQSLFAGPEVGAQVAAALPPMPSFRSDYAGAIAVIDWDHRLPSQALSLRIFAYYSEDTLEHGHEAFDDRLEHIAERARGGPDGLRVDDLPSMGAEDFAYMLAEKPGCYVWLGNGPGSGGCTLHNPHYDFNDDILSIGVSYWVRLAETVLKQGVDER